jgi:hypothetical protein
VTEAAITARVVSNLRARGILCRKIWQGPYSTHGVSDIIGLLSPSGRGLFIEMKTPDAYAKKNHNLSSHQARFLDDATKAGAIAFCACSWEMVRDRLGLS